MSTDRSSVGADRLREEEEVLLVVLEWFPINLARAELLRNLTVKCKGEADVEPYENAVAELRRFGLLRERADEVIEPTQALLAVNRRLDMQIEPGSRLCVG